jgi:hypothetical protein
VNRKLHYDLYHARHRRLLLELKITAATVKVMARGEGAHQVHRTSSHPRDRRVCAGLFFIGTGSLAFPLTPSLGRC